MKSFSTLICCGWAYGSPHTLFHLCRWGWTFGKMGTWLSISDVVRSWLRLQCLIDHIPYPYHVYAMCFSTLICCGWACGYSLTLFHLCRWWGGLLGEMAKWLWRCKVMVEAPKSQNCISHLYHVYTKCFSTLICCGWAYGCTHTLFHLCRWGWIFVKFGACWIDCDVVRSRLKLQSSIDCMTHIYHVYTKCFSTLICCGWAYGCTLTLFHLCRWGGLLEIWGYGSVIVML
jgi:hypothetical protein